MDDTISRLARVLGGQGIESIGHASRFAAEGSDGSRLKVSIETTQQRLMAALQDSKGVHRVEVDVAPIRRVTEDPASPGRVTLHVGAFQIRIDSRPSLAIEIVTSPERP